MTLLSMVVPTYNKGPIINGALHSFYTELKKTNMPFEIIIVNDGSTDQTSEAITEFCKSNNESKLINLEKNRGKGVAVLEGFKASKGDLVFFMDAGLDIPPQQIHLFLDYLNKYNADIVIGSKNHPDSFVKYPFSRKILSKCYQTLNFLLFAFPVSDTQVGLKLFKRDVLAFAASKMLVKKFAYDLELLVLANEKKHKIKEAPIEILQGHSSSVNVGSIFRIFIDTMAIWYRLKVLRYYKIK